MTGVGTSTTVEGGTVTVTQVRSGAHAKPKARGTLRALGLGRIGKTNTLPDRPEIRGMIARVTHLITVSAEEADEQNVSAEEADEQHDRSDATEGEDR